MTVTAVAAARGTEPSSPAPRSYTIERGDTLSGIAKAFGTTVSTLLRANPQIRNADVIYPGEQLVVPQGSGERPAPQAPSGTAATTAASGGQPASQLGISDKGVQLVAGFEGLKLTAYQDSGGVWTIGYGHTGGVQPGQQISQAQADAFLKQDLGWAQDAVRNNVDVPLSQNQFDALVSLTYNLGPNGYSGLLGTLNRGDYAGAQQKFGDYVHAGGQRLQGLVNRRATEAALFGSSAPGGSTQAPGPGAPPGGSTPAPSPSPSGTYTVRSGDTLSGIAARLDTSLPALLAANPQIRDPDRIAVGQSINVAARGNANTSPPSAAHDYTVRSGDTLSQIAAHSGVSFNSLMAANGQIGNPDLIRPGQTVHVPGSGQPAASTAPASHDVTVRAGDSMSAIALRNGVSLAALVRANPQVDNPDRIQPGQRLHVPGAGDGGSTAPSAPTAPTAPPSGSTGDGNRAASIARQFVGQTAAHLKTSGSLPMNPNVPNDVCCANFVSAVLQKAGVLDVHTDLVSGSSRSGTGVNGSIGQILKARGWNVVDAAHARPGDVAIVNNGHHVELVSSNTNGAITLIGSNNTQGGSGPQQISYSNPYGNAWYLSPP